MYIIFDKNFNNRYFITLEITLIHTVDIEDNKYYLNNIMEKVIPNLKQNVVHVASIRDVKFLPVIFDVNFPDGLILSHVLHSFSHSLKLLPLLMIKGKNLKELLCPSKLLKKKQGIINYGKTI